jgi:hypothetical protein
LKGGAEIQGSNSRIEKIVGQFQSNLRGTEHSGETAVLEKHYSKRTTLGDKAVDPYEQELAKED